MAVIPSSFDTLYTGDIPKDFKYARFNDNSIDLFNTYLFDTEDLTVPFYRIYLYDNQFMYSKESSDRRYDDIWMTHKVWEVNVSDNIVYRRDFPDILTIAVIISVFIVFLLNIMTSLIRKGGVLGGLL